jgi:DNA-binding response OmpR family regulator
MILLYEPDPDLAPLFAFLLEHLGCTVQVATTVADAIQIARQHAPTLAVVRPQAGADGEGWCRHLQRLIGTPVIGLVSPHGEIAPAADLHLLPLPVSPRALRELVQLVLPVVLI